MAGLLAAVMGLVGVVMGGAVGFALYERQVSRELTEARDEAQLRTASLAVDIDLKYCEDGKVEYGLLRLARTLKTLPAHATALRECVEMNLFAWGQEIRPLGPPLTHEGARCCWIELDSDGLTLLTVGDDGTARLWDSFTCELRATMKGVREFQFSHDGSTVLTVGEDRTVCLRDARTGQVRTVTEIPSAFEQVLLSPDAQTASYDLPSRSEHQIY